MIPATRDFDALERGLEEVSPDSPAIKLTIDESNPADTNILLRNIKNLGVAINQIATAQANAQACISRIRNQAESALTVGPGFRDPWIRALQEETQILWWLFGQWSSIQRTPFESLAESAAPLVLGAELAGAMNLIPPHPRRDALLSRALGAVRGRSVTLSALATSASQELTSHVPSHGGALTPVLLAIAERAQSPDAWLPRWSSQTSLSADLSLPTLQWAEQFCDEILLARLLNDASA